MAQDWKDALASLRNDMPADADGTSVTDNDAVSAADAAGDGATSVGGRTLHLFYEKKGRAGKPATIITGFDENDDTEVLDVARTLKQRIGCGGSARGGEILLQGERREQAKNMLREMGYKVK